MKLKVSKVRLRKAIVEYVEKDKQRFERETEKFEAKQKLARANYIARLSQYLSEVKAGETIIDSYHLNGHLTRGCEFPTEPKKATDYGALLQRLDLAEDQVLTVDDESEYMRFLAGECVCR